MTMIGAIGGLPRFTPITPLTPPGGTDAATRSRGASGDASAAASAFGSFADTLGDQIVALDDAQRRASDLAVQAATGDLQSIHELTIATTEAELLTQLTVSVRNRAVEAFNEIMRMQV